VTDTQGEDPGTANSWRYIRRIVLAYLLMYPLPWIAQAPDARDLLASAVGIAVFVPLFFRGYGCAGWTRLAYSAAYVALGLALAPCGGLWTIFIVYACAQAGYSRPPRIAAAGLAAILAAFPALAWAAGRPWTEWVFGELIGAIIGLCCAFGAALHERNRALAEAREQLRQLAVGAERERIARDLHDVLGHTLTLIAVKADLARRLLERDPAGAQREIDEIHQSARGALAEVRAALTGVRAATLADELEQARRALQSAGIGLAAPQPLPALPPRVDVTLGYVLREATTNVIRHSAARHCEVRLDERDGAVHLQVRDDGRGGALEGGNGLRGMRQRLAAVGGALSVQSAPPPHGVCLVARVPLAPETA
jgi:two-component system sensor histidine kinase DesK